MNKTANKSNKMKIIRLTTKIRPNRTIKLTINNSYSNTEHLKKKQKKTLKFTYFLKLFYK